MLYNTSTPFSFHIELTDKCNARCPQCSRNVIDPVTGVLDERKELPLKELSLEDFKSIFDDFSFNIDRMNFCGNFGDPFFAKDIFSISEYIGKDIQEKSPNFKFAHFHTNGGFRSAKWWKSYGELVSKYLPKKHMVTFSIDGLEDTHHLYRVNTRYDRVVENARAFIEGGGNAEWSFIKFGHNQHQEEEAKRRAKEYGFKAFIPVQTHRFWGKSEKSFIFNDEEYTITAATDKVTQERQEKVKEYSRSYEVTRKIDCHVQNKQEVFIDCTGEVTPCCWIGSWVYRNKYIKDVHPDDKNHHPMFNMRDERNAITEPLDDIVIDDFFQYVLPASFEVKPCEICVRQCSKADVKTIKVREHL
jgi:MoaA/NifB/PqqE/SkfB family radical SAM enzyme